MPRQGLDAGQVVEEAVRIADADGLEAVTLARVSAMLGVRAPSLYNHVAGREALLRGIALRGLHELGDALRRAAVGRAREDALVAVAHAYRAYAHAHPGCFAATIAAPAPGDVEHEQAAAEVVGVIAAIVIGWGIEDDDAIHAVRTVRSALHGFVTLEAAGGFGTPVDRDISFERLLQTLAAGLASAAPAPA
ncbi:MAG TPA: TetR/AcrR family transcriptional regulator [Conexibacter sp.]|nr:TetR/AcrR family transcriptional regulator [Conexibacter sp.]